MERAEREFTERLYNGTAPVPYKQASLQEELPGVGVTLPEFQHWATIAGAARRTPWAIQHL